MSPEIASIELFGKPFSVLWHSQDHRRFSNRETCYELVSFAGLETHDQGRLREGLPVKVERVWVRNRDYRPNALLGKPPTFPGSYFPREARGLRRLHPKTLNLSTSPKHNMRAALLLSQICKTEFHIPVSGPAAALLSKPGLPLILATFGNGDIHFLNDVVRCPLPCEARQQFLLESLTAANQQETAATMTSQPEQREPVPPAPPSINETILWRVQQQIMDELDTKLRSAPSASLVFTRYCRDGMTLVEMGRKFRWSYRTLKQRKRILKGFLWQKHKLTLEAFFVDGRIFEAAQRQLDEWRAERLSRRALGECNISEADGQSG